MKNPQWIDSLEPYLSASNEDEQIALFFDRVVVPAICHHLTGCIRWLDIGTGNGSKLLRCAQLLGRALEPESISLVMVDPDFDRRTETMDAFSKEIGNSVSQAVLEARTLEAYLNQAVSEGSLEFNLISAFHFHYSPDTCAATTRLFKLDFTADAVVWFLVSEAPTSDFHKLRSRLESADVPVPKSTLDDFAGVLSRAGCSVRRYEIDNQRCQINRDILMSDDSHWLFSFLLGRTHEQIKDLDSKTQRTVRRIAREYIIRLPSDALTTPDTAYVAVKPKRK